MSDLLGSVVAIIAAILIIIFGWMRAEPILSLLAALLIVRSAWHVARQSAHILLKGTLERIALNDVHQAIVSIPEFNVFMYGN